MKPSRKRDSMENTASSAPALTRGLKILEIISECRNGMGFAEILARAGVPKPSLVRLLKTLLDAEYLGKDKGNYKLGIKLLVLGGKLIGSIDIKRKAAPFLYGLRDKTKETVELGIFNGKDFVIVEKIESEESIRLYSYVGDSPEFLHSIASGKIVLACAGDKFLSGYLKGGGLPKKTANTITSAAVLKKQLEQIKEKGYAVDEQEHRADVTRVASPVFDHGGKFVAAVDIAGPSYRINSKNITNIAEAVKSTAGLISKELGYVAGGENDESIVH